jgi:hypothetical protein
MKLCKFTYNEMSNVAKEIATTVLPYDNVHPQRAVIPALFGLVESLWSPEVKQFVEGRKQDKIIDSLVRLSGEGKTCRLLAYGTQRYLIFINCSQTNSTMTDTAAFLRDESFIHLQINLESTITVESDRNLPCIH